MLILQFVTVRTPDATARLVRLGSHPAVSTILDLEDGLWDPLDEGRTRDLKAAGREHLVDMARGHASLLDSGSLGVRINRISGPEGHRDIESLGHASRHVTFDHVIAPKVERGSDLSEVVGALRDGGVRFGSIVPIVETQTGIAALDEILEVAIRLGVRWLVYGHFDYALDSGWWPIPGPEDPEYWSGLAPIIFATEAAGIGHVHPPYFALADNAAFERLVRRLTATCRHPFGMVTIGRQQTALAARLATSLSRADSAVRTRTERAPELSNGLPRDRLRADDVPVAVDARRLATHVVETYIANRRADVSFALDPDTGEFISPHVYMAARAYLSRSPGA